MKRLNTSYVEFLVASSLYQLELHMQHIRLHSTRGERYNLSLLHPLSLTHNGDTQH